MATQIQVFLKDVWKYIIIMVQAFTHGCLSVPLHLTVALLMWPVDSWGIVKLLHNMAELNLWGKLK